MRLGYKYLFAVIILLFIFTGMILAQSNPTIEVKAFDGYIRVSWTIDSEVGVDHYEVWRSCGISIPIQVADNLKPGVRYFDDTTVGLYKIEDQYFSYQVRVIGSNQRNSGVQGIRYTNPSSTPKRTWGSIKAMFR